MADGDLTTLDAVAQWLGQPNPPPGIAATILPGLITSTSADFLRMLGRTDFFPDADFTEVREGDGGVRMTLRHWPVNSIASVTVAGTGLAPSPDKVADGYYIDDDLDPEERDQLYVIGGLQDLAAVVVVYNAGYAEPPEDVAQAVTEWVADRYTERASSGKSSQRAAGGEHVSFEHEQDSIPPQVQRVIDRYMHERPSLNRRKDDRDDRVTRINRTYTEKVSE